MAYNLFETPKLTKPIQAYDPTKSVQQNMNGQGQPSAQNIVAAYQTPQAQLQLQQGQAQQQTQQQRQIGPIDKDSPTSGMEAVLQQMYTSPEQEEKIRKASIANQRIMAVADALRHIGNIYHTVNYSPSQQFNSPVVDAEARYEKGKAVRDAANLKYYTYQQAKAAQDAKQRQLDNDWKYKEALLRHYDRQEDRLRERDANQKENQEARRDLDREKFELDKKYKDKRISISEYNAQTSRIRAVKSGRAGGGGNNYWAYDQEGNIHYYPNRAMWEQAVYQFNKGLPQTETFENTISGGEKTYRQSPMKPSKIGGNAAANATNGSRGGGAFSGFSIHKK